DYANTGKQITRNGIIGKQMVVHVGNSSTVNNVLDLEMLFETEGAGPIGKFKEVEIDADNESEEESDTEGDYTSGSDSEDLDYDPKHDEVFDDDEHIVEVVHVSMNNFCFTIDPKHDLSIGVVEVHEDDLDVIDYDSFGSDLDYGINSERRIQLRELRRIGKHKNKGPNKVRCEGIILALVPYVAIETDMGKNEFSQTKGGLVIRENNNSGKQNILGKDKTCQEKGKKVNKQKKVDKYSCPWTMLVAYTNKGRWEVRTLIEDHNCLQSREIKACASRFLSDHIIKSPTTNHDIHVRAVQDQMEQYSLLRESAQDLINQNPCTTVRIDVQQEPNPESMTRSFRRVYVYLGALKQGFKACGKEILGLDGCFMSGPWPGQILTVIVVDANNGIYPVAYVIVEAESKASWCWFLNLLGGILVKKPNSITLSFLIGIRDLDKPLQVYFRVLNTAKATSIGEFNKKLAELKSFNSASYDWLMKIPAEQWSRAYFSGRAKCDLLLNNICDVFNRQLVDGRDQPIITCLQYIREYLMKRIVVVRKVIAKTVGPLTPYVTAMDQCVVNIDTRVCSYRKWELTRIPCKHVVVAIYNMSENSMGVGIPELWVHVACKLET
ncbi:mutator type transposase, partial [Tanacetum coccineum]